MLSDGLSGARVPSQSLQEEGLRVEFQEWQVPARPGLLSSGRLAQGSLGELSPDWLASASPSLLSLLTLILLFTEDYFIWLSGFFFFFPLHQGLTHVANGRMLVLLDGPTEGGGEPF